MNCAKLEANSKGKCRGKSFPLCPIGDYSFKDRLPFHLYIFNKEPNKKIASHSFQEPLTWGRGLGDWDINSLLHIKLCTRLSIIKLPQAMFSSFCKVKQL